MDTNFKAVLAALIKTNGMVVDAHTPASLPLEKRMRRIPAVARLGNDAVAMSTDAPYHTLNALYTDANGVVYLSSMAMGGLMDYRGHAETQDAINAYNDPKNHHFGVVPVTEFTEIKLQPKNLGLFELAGYTVSLNYDGATLYTLTVASAADDASVSSRQNFYSKHEAVMVFMERVKTILTTTPSAAVK